MEHPLESELKQFIVEKKVSKLGDLTNEYATHPKVSHIHVIGCKLLALDASPFSYIFKNTKDIQLIEELINEYGFYPELAELFIPETVMAIGVYHKLALENNAQNLINQLIEQDASKYCEEVFNLKELIFTGAIGLTIKNFNPANSDPFLWLENKILNKEADPSSDEESIIRFNNFYFYKLNNFSIINKEQEDDFFKIIEAPIAPKKFKTKKNNQLIKIFLLGYVWQGGVKFNIHLSSVKNLYQGLPVTSIVLPDDFGNFLKDVVKEGALDQISDKIKDYIVSYFPLVKEAKLIADLGEVVVKNTFKTNPDSLINLMDIHIEELNKKQINIKEYYINYYLVDEFQKFFNKKDFPLKAKDFYPVFNTLYEYYIQNIKGFLSGKYEDEAFKLIAANPHLDKDTIIFKCVYAALNDVDSQIKRKLFEKKSLS